MNILCGTDFSNGARDAVDVAADLARVLRARLVLAHVLDMPGAEEVLGAHVEARVTDFFEGEKARLEGLLRAEAKRVADSSATIDVPSIDVEVLLGRADEALIAHAARMNADLLVVAALGKRGEKLWSLGSTADRIAQSSPTPVLVVRDAAPFAAWSMNERRLRVLVGIDFTPSATAALRWAQATFAPSPCDLAAVHVYWPPEMRDRLQHRSLAIGDEATVAREVGKDLEARLAAAHPDLSIPLRVVGGLGRPADHLAQLASAEKFDLIVVGTNQRTGVSRVWHGSKSHDVVVRAPTSVAVVPNRA
jgi:nucleotide-binding universal stress UspA family protein